MNTKSIIAAAAMATLLAGCSSDELTDSSRLPDGQYPLKIASVSVEGSAPTRIYGSDNYCAFENDTIKVRIGEGDSENTVGIYLAMSDLFFPEMEESIIKTAYWQSPEPQTVTAWYPAVDKTIDLSDQTAGLPYVLKATAENQTYSSYVDLNFKHQLAKFRLTLKDGDGSPSLASRMETVTFNNLITSCSTKEGTVTAGTEKGSVTPYKSGDCVYEALLTPQSIEADKEFVTMTIGGREYIVKPSSAISLEVGKIGSYTATFTGNGTVTLTADKFTSWNNGGVETVLSDGANLKITEATGNITVAANSSVTIEGDGTTTVYNSNIVVGDGSTVTLKNLSTSVTGGYGIQCLGDATLKMEGTNSVTTTAYGQSGITVASGKTLTIEGDGELTVKGASMGPGIGAANNASCGDIVINSSTITAIGYNCSAGIGASRGGACGNITINGGTITATGDYWGAGIGAGDNGYSKCGNITITGGTVTARGNLAAGIGAAKQSSSVGNITIKGQNTVVDAKGTTYSEGVYVYVGAYGGGTCGTITYSDGATVNGVKYTEETVINN